MSRSVAHTVSANNGNPQVDEVLDRIVLDVRHLLGESVVSVLLYGSLVTGDFDLDASDLDLLVVLAEPLGDLAGPAEVHRRIEVDYPRWKNRIEVAYVSADALRTFREKPSPIAVISPGEPLATKEAGKDWLINWYTVRAQGQTLYGAGPDQIIPDISHAELVEAIRLQAEEWREWVTHSKSRPFQGYAILTMCRALHLVRTGTQASKLRAAHWAMEQLPAEAPLISQALAWRKEHREPVADPSTTLPQTVTFVHRIADLIAAG